MKHLISKIITKYCITNETETVESLNKNAWQMFSERINFKLMEVHLFLQQTYVAMDTDSNAASNESQNDESQKISDDYHNGATHAVPVTARPCCSCRSIFN